MGEAAPDLLTFDEPLVCSEFMRMESSADFSQYSGAASSASRGDQAIESFAHAMRLNPIDPCTWFIAEGMAHAHFFADRYDEALKWAKVALRELPDSRSFLLVAAASSALAGCDEEAKRLTARLLEIDPALRISTIKKNLLGPWRPEYVAKHADALRKADLRQ